MQNPQVIRISSDYEFCCFSAPFRIFYSLDGSARSPVSVQSSGQPELPDYIVDLVQRFQSAYRIFTETLQLQCPLSTSDGYIQGAKFFDILIDDIPLQRGLVAANPVAHDHLFSANVAEQVMPDASGIRIVIHRDLISGTATPIHELFHAFQYNYCPFNNMWFMEGLARWVQNLTHDRKELPELLPQSLSELLQLFQRQHDAEYFWRRLLSFVHEPYAFIRLFLEACQSQSYRLQQLGDRPVSEDWSREQKRSRANNPVIIKALLQTLDRVPHTRDQELTGFYQLMQSYADNPNRVDGDLVIRSVAELMAAQTIEEVTGDLTLSIPELVQLSGWPLLQQVGGTLRIQGCSRLRSLDGFDGLQQVQHLEIADNPQLNRIEGFLQLFRRQPQWPGMIRIHHNPVLTSVDFLLGLRSTGSSLYLHHNALESLHGLECLQTVGASLSLSSNALEDLSPLRQLRQVRGMLGLAFNRLSTLSGLENLHSLSVVRWNQEYRSLALQGNPQLNDLTALSQVQSDTGALLINMDSDVNVIAPDLPESPFYQQRIKLFNKDKKVETAQVFPLYPSRQPKRVLFDSSGWQKALRDLEGIEVYFTDFRDIGAFLRFAERHDIDIVYGQLAKSQFFLNRHKDALYQAGIAFMATDQNFVSNCVDKDIFYRFMEQCGKSDFIPRVYKGTEDIEYPAIIKQPTGGNGRGMEIINTPDELAKSQVQGVLSEYVKGDEEYATNVIFYQGEILFERTYRRTFNTDTFILKAADQSSAVLAVDVVEPPCTDTFRDILCEFSHELICCCFDYKMKNGVPKIFEINTRLGYTLARDQESFMAALNLYCQLVEQNLKIKESQGELRYG